MMGAERRSMVMTDEEKRLTAYHEAGHAVVALHQPASDPIHKATIIPRGRALGMVMRLPEGDRVSMARDKLYADLRVACGGRIAEELIFGEAKVTTGASSDIRMVSDVARRMVTEWGMSEKLGFLAYAADEQEVFLGRSVSQQKNMSDTTAMLIDSEIRVIVDSAYEDAEKILKDHNDELELLAKALLEYETLSGDEIKTLIEGGTIVREDDDTPEARGANHAQAFPAVFAARAATKPLTRQPDPVQPERLTQPGFPPFADDRQHGGKSRTWVIPGHNKISSRNGCGDGCGRVFPLAGGPFAFDRLDVLQKSAGGYTVATIAAAQLTAQAAAGGSDAEALASLIFDRLTRPRLILPVSPSTGL